MARARAGAEAEAEVGGVFVVATRGLVLNLAVIFTVSYLVTLRAMPLRLERPVHRLTAAAVFFSLSLLTLAMPLYTAPGVRLDMRPPLLGFAGWLGGPWVALPAAAGVAVVRYAMGGAGAWAGVLGCFLSAAAGLLFYRRPRTGRNLSLFTIACFLGVMLVGLLIPGYPLYAMPFPLALIVSYTAATLVFHYLAREFETKVHMEEQLYDELRLKETVLQAVDTGIAVFDGDGRLTLLNSAAREILELAGDPIGLRAADLFTGSPALAERVSRRERFSHELHVLRRGESELYLAVTGLPADRRMILALSNVSRVIASEREEARRRRLLALGELAAMAAHEIKNPLTTIKGFVQLLSGRPGLDEGARRYASVIAGEVEAINRVVSDFLLLARSRSETLEPVALSPLLSEVAEETALRFPGAQVAVRTALELPELVTDRQALKQVLLNLYANAYDAMGGQGALQVRVAAAGSDALLEVQDSGPGIAPEVLCKLFRPFTTTKSEGSGLGLAICERLVSNLHGEITAVSPPGSGALFRVRLPQAGLAAASRSTTA